MEFHNRFSVLHEVNMDKVSDNERVTHVISDSICRGQGTKFAANRKGKKRCVTVIPGAKIHHIKEKVSCLKIDKDDCLVVNVGINDMHGGIPKRGASAEVVKKYFSLIKEMKDKSNKCVVMGILSRVNDGACTRNEINILNGKIREFCRQEKLTFVDVENIIEGDRKYYVTDGIHLSNQGKKVLAGLINEGVYRACTSQGN